MGKWSRFGVVLDACESRLEWLFAHAILFTDRYSFEPAQDERLSVTARALRIVAVDRSGVALGQQVPVEEYFLDFALARGAARVAIELDGFEYHDATPERAERDKRRDRVLTAAGWRVLRFAGREVVRDPRACVGEAYEVVRALSPRAPQQRATAEAPRPPPDPAQDVLSPEAMTARANELLAALEAMGKD